MSIKIKDSKKGTLHDAVGVDRDKKIPSSKLKIHEGDSAALKKKKQFAINAKKWNKGQDGISIPNNYQQSDDEMFKRFQQSESSVLKPMQHSQEYLDWINTNGGPSGIGSVEKIPKQYSGSLRNSVPQNVQNAQLQPVNIPSPPNPQQPYQGQYGDAALAGLLAVDALIPKKKQPSQIVRPLNSYNPNPYGTGSTALAQNGMAVSPKFKIPQMGGITYEDQQGQANNVKGQINNARKGEFNENQSLGAQNSNNYLNTQQQYFYNALNNPSTNLTDVYKGFNEELVGQDSQNNASIHPGGSPFTGTSILSNEDKQLLQNEYINYSQKYKGNKQNYFKDLQGRGATDERINNLIPAASFAFGTQYENGGKISNTGYKANSPDRWQPKLTIPSNQITMENVPHQVYGIDDMGFQQIMNPGENYTFPGNQVTEFPIKKMGGKLLCKNGGKIGKPYSEGQTYEFDDATIKDLISQGYEIKIN